MKIGILSLNPGHNYGGILQSYALKTVLERMGHEVSVISRNKYLKVYHPVSLIKYTVRFFYKYVLGKDVKILKEMHHNKWIAYTYNKMLLFCSRRLDLRVVDNLNEIRPSEYEAYIVGSDQVWRPKYFKEQMSHDVADAYLKFAREWNVKRIAYAPSFGVDQWEYSSLETKECAELLQKFDGVSVREEAGVKLCKDHFNIDAVCLCDPTMLLKKEDYESLVDESTPKSKGNLLVYCLDESEELNTLVERIAKEKSLVPFSTNIDEYTNSCVKDSVESWIRGFMDAEFVITDSFHACVFSLIFRKPFIVLGNKDRGMSRFESLLSRFGQQHRLLHNFTDYNPVSVFLPINGVYSTFSIIQSQAREFLKEKLQ